MRKTIIIILSIIFTGALLIYTAQANLDLLSKVSPNPQFVGFAMIALEGGVIYWIGYYLLHWNGTHKGIAICMIFIDFVFSMVGFFVDSNMVASEHGLGSTLSTWFPHVILFVTLDVVLNVFVGVVVHLLPDNRQVTREDFRPALNAASHVVARLPKRGNNNSSVTHVALAEEIESADDLVMPQLNSAKKKLPPLKVEE